MRQQAAALLRGRPVNQRKLDERRGFWKGAQWVLDNPDLADLAFEQAVKQMERNQP